MKGLERNISRIIRALHYCGLTYTEVAKATGIPRGTVASLLQRAKARKRIVARPIERNRLNWTPAQFAASIAEMRVKEYGGQPPTDEIILQHIDYMVTYLTRKYGWREFIQAVEDAGVDVAESKKALEGADVVLVAFNIVKQRLIFYRDNCDGMSLTQQIEFLTETHGISARHTELDETSNSIHEHIINLKKTLKSMQAIPPTRQRAGGSKKI